MYYVYIVECADKTLYVGYTNNLKKRILQHNHSKRGAHYTKLRRPVVFKYQETFTIKSKAMKRELEIKRWRRAEKLALINSQNL